MLENNPLWYKDAVIYELHVRAYHDSVGDGMGDFRGLTEKLDYLQDLGVSAIWLLPFYPSPLKDDGYDIADYTDLHPDYGKLRDFREFLDAAHARGLRVITELVINHTSDLHPWFQRARRAPPGSAERDFYVWSDTPDRYREARIIFQDFEHSNWSWDPVAKAYFWHRFYSHQPDLNYDNEAVWKAIFPVLDFWMEMGVDGMRLDAVPYLYEREGTNCENLPETHRFLKALRGHVDSKFSSRMLLAEANQWPEDAVAYFGNGDEAHMAFHFPLMPRMFMAIHMEDRYPIIDIMSQTPQIPSNCQWGLFLRNHDELTLEMVTDEERDYMYRAYASDLRARVNLGIRRRLAPLLGNNRRRIELMNGLLFSLPGTPIIYYGDEIGMGDNIYLGDRNSVRTPMQWSSDRNAGFSRANPQKLYLPVIIDPEYHYESVNVEAQQNNPNSLLWWMKRLISLRKRHLALGRGSLQFLNPANRKILAFLRRHENETILVVVNLSRFVQYVELDLAEFFGRVPVELFGRNPFPRIGKQPYFLTLGPHSFYWFSLEEPGVTVLNEPAVVPAADVPVVTIKGSWENGFRNPARPFLEKLLPAFLVKRGWFVSKRRGIKTVRFREIIPVTYGKTTAYVTLIEVEFNDDGPETYVLPLAFAAADQADQLLENQSHVVLARLEEGEHGGLLYDALASPQFCTAILEGISQSATFELAGGAELQTFAFPEFRQSIDDAALRATPAISRGAQANTSVVYGDRLILKVFRRVEQGINPELEIGRFLTQKGTFAGTAPVFGAIEYRRKRRGEVITLGVLQQFIPNEGDAWQYTLDILSRFYERVLTSRSNGVPKPAPPDTPLAALGTISIPAEAHEMFDTYLETVRLLGRRTAEMHQTLASDTDDPDFAPEPYTSLYQRSLYQSMRNLKAKVFHLLGERMVDCPPDVQELARQLIGLDGVVVERFRSILTHRMSAMRIRCHGDYHLGQLLHTGKDFIIIDFEGDPARSINDRRIKRSPLRDVASMIRSFHYAAHSALLENGSGRGRSPGVIRQGDLLYLEPWARFWYAWTSVTYLLSYLEIAEGQSFLPASREELRILLDAFLLEKAISELGYEIVHRPGWVKIPLLGILELLRSKDSPE